MVHDLSVLILGSLSDTSFWLYSALDLILSVVLIMLCLFPFILIIKVLGGKQIMFLVYKTGSSFVEVFNWYVAQVLKIFDVMRSFEVFPNVTYFDFFLAFIALCLLFKIIKWGYNQSMLTDVVPSYAGKHSEEYLAEHTKTGKGVKNKVVQMTGKHVKK